MARNVDTKYVCVNCGAESPKWVGKCMGCNEWNTMEQISIGKKSSGKKSTELPKVSKLEEVVDEDRVATGIDEFDRVLGGGAVKGEIMLIGGAPGIGKSTLLLNICEKLATDHKVLYFSAEESISQISRRAARVLGSKESVEENLSLVSSSDADDAVEFVASGDYDFVVVDSIQTVSTGDLSSLSGGTSQVRECASRLTRAAKETGTIVVLVGHVTKGGEVAGPMVLSHVVDAVFVLEGEDFGNLRILRGLKNRFGNVNEIGMFEMGEKGLVPVSDVSEVLIGNFGNAAEGVVRGVLVEGVRPMMIDVQSLVIKTSYAMPKRVANGIDLNRLQMLIAILSKVGKINLSEYDVFVNVVGGMRVKDPALDLPICMAIFSSYTNRMIPQDSVYIGEVGLSGEVRPAIRHQHRVGEAKRLGYKNVLSASGKSYKNLSEFLK